MINVGRIVNSRNFAQSNGITVHRKTGGHWEAGRFVQTEIELTFGGTVTPCSPKELAQVPEGDRVAGIMCFHSEQKIYTTYNDVEKGTSDEIEWQGERYRIASVIPYVDFGYWKAFGVRMVSD